MAKPKLSSLIFGLFTALAMLLAACQAAPATPAQPAQPAQPTEAAKPAELVKVTLRLPWITNTQFAGPYVALDKGYFKDEGIDLEILPGGIDKNSITLVAAGENTFGLHDTGSLLLARAQDMPLVTVATFFQKHPGGVFALKKSGINTLKDFEGKTIGFQEGGPWMLTKAMLKKNGVDMSKIKTQTIQYDVSPLLNGQIDLMTCYATNEPLAVKRQHGEDVVVFLPADNGIPTASEALFTTEKYLSEHPEVVQGMVNAFKKGWEYAMANKDEAVKIVMKYGTELDYDSEMDQLVAEEAHLMTPEAKEHGIGWMTAEKWDQMYQVLREEGALETDVDVSKAFTTQFLGK